MKKISLDKWKRNKTLKLIKIAFGGKNGKTKIHPRKSAYNKIKLKTQ